MAKYFEHFFKFPWFEIPWLRILCFNLYSIFKFDYLTFDVWFPKFFIYF